MNTPAYSQPGFPVLLARAFRDIVKGGRPPAQACEMLTLTLRSPDIETLPALPDGWRLIVVDGDLMVEALDGALTAAGNYIFQPRRDVLLRFQQARGKLTPEAAAVIEDIESDLNAPLSETAIEALATPKPRASRRGRKAYNVWQPMFDHLDALVKKRGKPFETYTEAAGYGLEFLQALAKQRREEHKGAPVPAVATIREKIAELRPDLVCD